MRVSLVIPTKNEAGALEKTIKEIPQGCVDEIIVSDGHSTDGTLDIAVKLGCKAITQEGKGYGLGILSGVKIATGDVIVIMDGDGSQIPADIPRLLEKIKEGYDIGWGSRYLGGGKSLDDTWLRYFGNQLFTFLIRFIHGLKITDILYMFPAFKKEIFDKVSLQFSDFRFGIELPVKAHKAGFKFGEVACVERKRMTGETKVKDLADGYKIFKAILKKY